MATSSSPNNTDNSYSDEDFIKSRQEDGRYVNSFNPDFQFPGYLTLLRWLLTTKKNSNVPQDEEELSQHLPIIKHAPDEIVKKTPGLRFIWIGHASCLVQIDNFTVLTDPLFSTRCGFWRSSGPKRFRPPALTVDELPAKLDAVVISHNHYDHLDRLSVLSLHERYGSALTWYCGRGGRDWFLSFDIENVIELDWWEQHKHSENEDISIAFCPAQHWSRRGAFDFNKSLWGGFAIWNKNYKFYFVGDTGYTHNINIFKQIGKRYGPFDLCAIPIGAYEPRWMMEAQHVSPLEAVQIHMDLQSKKSIGIHWGTLSLANEFYLEPKEKLAETLKYNKLDARSFIVVKHGEIFDLPENN